MTLEPRLLYLYTPFREQSDLPLFDTVRDPRLPHTPTVVRGVAAEASATLLRDFFATRRT